MNLQVPFENQTTHHIAKVSNCEPWIIAQQIVKL